MHLEVKVALNFIVSYLYNKLPRRRADLFGEELERILVSRFEGHWYPEAPLRGSAFRCLHLGARRDPVVELAARRSGLDTEEVRANVPAELSVWMDPYEVSYQIGETGAVKVLYLEDPPGAAGESDRREAPGGEAADEAKSLGFNPEAQVFVPIGGQASPVPRPSLSCSPAPPSAAPPPCPALFSYPSSGTPTAHSSNPSTPSPPLGALSYLAPQQAPPGLPGRPPLQPITFTTASFAATKFGSTKMKKSGGAGPAGGSGSGSGSGGGVAVVTVPPPQRILSRSPPLAAAAPGQLLKHKPLALSLQALGPPAPPSQLSPNAKEFVFPGSPGALYFEVDSQPMVPHTGPFHMGPRPAYDPFTGPAAPGPGAGLVGGGGGGVGVGVGGMSYTEKPPFGEGLGGYNLQYSSQSFQPVVLAN